MEKHVEDTVAGGTWIFLGSLAVSLTGFVFWLVVARVAGVESVGIASAVMSSALMASTLVSAGMNIAVIREVASKGARAFIASLTLASVASMVAASLSILLVHGLGYDHLIPIASLLAVSYVLSIPVLYSLIGMERFRSYFTATLAGSIAKLSVGTTLAALGLGALAPLLGYLAHPITASLLALTYLTSLQIPRTRPRREDLRSVAVLTLSNYPFMFSSQLLTMLNIYMYAYLVRETASTGVLYIAMMITLAIMAIPFSFLNAALSVGIRRNVDVYVESLRIGLALTTPVVALVLAMPKTILELINPELISGVNTLRILLLSIIPSSTLMTLITKLNHEGETLKLTVIGTSLLLVLIVLMIPLTKLLRDEGAALAFLAANTLLMLVTIRYLPNAVKNVGILWSTHLSLALLSYLALVNEFFMSIIAVTVSATILLASKIIMLNEINQILKMILKVIFHSKVER